jgi:hypothetical protein
MKALMLGVALALFGVTSIVHADDATTTTETKKVSKKAKKKSKHGVEEGRVEDDRNGPCSGRRGRRDRRDRPEGAVSATSVDEYRAGGEIPRLFFLAGAHFRHG